MARFGSFEIDSDRRQLLHGDGQIHLTPKAFELLSVLVDAAPRVLTKAALHERLWPKGVVSDATLIGLVKEIRRALTGADRSAAFIRTVHRVGYAFDAAVVHAAPRSGGPARWVVLGERRIALHDGENVVGRDPEADVSLDYATVSRRHARLLVQGTGTVLEDLGSKNGTTRDGARLTGAVGLHDGDRFACGGVLLTYRESGAGFPTVTQASRIGAGAPRG
ncbi:MAG TPA: FHA domain-containing protein [Gammaproteobacteria bacterium]|nr:FHA domain-containing protein [Gammaproteobacteria bacterium]